MIKPMKCPHKDGYCVGQQFFDKELDAWNGWLWHVGCRHKTFWSKFKLLAILRWNAWCRRELRRMKKEEKGK